MPWKIMRNGENEHCVVKEDTGETVKCHVTRAEAVAHMKALYSAEGVEKSTEELEKCYPEPYFYGATSFAEAEQLEESYHKQMEVRKLFGRYLDMAQYIAYSPEVEIGDKVGKLDALTQELATRVQESTEYAIMEKADAEKMKACMMGKMKDGMSEEEARKECEAMMEEEAKDMEEMSKAVWDSAYQSELPDSAFMYVEPNSEKDETGRTTPRSKRHFPIKNKEGQHDMSHVRNAIQRIPQSNAPGLTPEKKEALQNKARKILESLNKSIELFKADPAKHLVYGLVLVPGHVDSQNDVIDEAEIEHAAHEFFRKSRILDHQHKEDLPPSIAEPVESYVMPATVNVGGKIIKRGSWILVSKIHDSGLWEKIQRGELLSYSIRGVGKREPIELSEEDELVPA